MKKNKQKYSDYFDDNYPGQCKFDREKIFRIIKDLDPNVDSLGFQKETSITYSIFKSLIYRKMLSKQRKCSNLLESLKKYANQQSHLNKHRWYEYFVEIKPVKVKDFYN